MLFSRVASFFAFTLALGGLVGAKPAAQAANMGAVQQVILDLKTSTDAIVPEIS